MTRIRTLRSGPLRWALLLALVLPAGCRAMTWTDWSRAVRPSPRPDRPVPPDLSSLGMRFQGQDLDLALSADQAVALALANHPAYRAVLEEKEKARGQAMTAWSSVLPKVDLGLNYTRLDEVTSFTLALPGAPPSQVKLNVRDNYKAELTVTQPLFLGGRGLRSIQLAGLGRDAADLAAEEAALSIAYAVRNTYLQALFAREAVAVHEKALENARAHLDDVSLRLEQEMGTRFDVLRAEVRLANARAELLEAQNQRHIARSALVRLMGLPQSARVRLEDPLAYQPRTADEHQALQKAFRMRPDIRRARLAVDMRDKEVGMALSELMPQAFAFFHWGWDKPSSRSFGASGGDNYWDGGIGIDVPLFDGGAALGKIRKAYASLRSARWQWEDLRQEAALEVRQAVASLHNAAAFLASQKKNVEQAEESLRLARLGFEQGARTHIEVLDAQTALTAARIHRLQAVYKCRAAALALDRAQGGLENPGQAPPEKGKGKTP